MVTIFIFFSFLEGVGGGGGGQILELKGQH